MFKFFLIETLSDASDIEVRIRALSEDLKRKKNEADRLRQEKKAKYKEKLKAQEESLIKQIEVIKTNEYTKKTPTFCLFKIYKYIYIFIYLQIF